MPAPYDLFNYRDYWAERSYEDGSEKIALERLLKKIPRGGKIVDIGGGYGRLCSAYLNQFEEIVVLDSSEKNLREGRKIYKDYKNISFEKGILPHLPYPDRSFETALMVRVLHHLEEPRLSFRETARIVKDGGFFIFEVANKIHLPARIKAWLRADFTFGRNYSPLDQRSKESIKERKITFVNHHPQKIISDLRFCGFKVWEILSVSNFRHPLVKKVIPKGLLLKLERAVQKPFASFFIGPSIFILCRKEIITRA